MESLGIFQRNIRILSVGLREAFCRNSINIFNCRCKRRYFNCQAHIDYAQARIFRHLANQHNFWSLSTFLKKHQILSRSLTESLSGNSVKISDCREFSPFKTLPGSGTRLVISAIRAVTPAMEQSKIDYE